MALKQDENGFLVGTPVEAIKRLSDNMRKIKEDVAQIKQLLKLSSSEKVKNNRATQSTESKPKQERVNESRLRDSRGRFTSQYDSQQQEQQRQENQANRKKHSTERRLSDVLERQINETRNRERNRGDINSGNESANLNSQEQERQKTERKRDANGRFISENNNNVIESKSRKRNAKGQFEGNGSAEEKSFLSRSFDSLGEKITGAIELGTGGLEDVDPTVKAFQEVAEPLSRGYQFLTGNKEEKRDKKYFGWLGKIWKSVKKTEDNTEESNRDNGNGESFLGSLLGAKAIVAVLTTVLGLIFSPIGLAIGAAGVAAWGLFTKSGNKFFSNLTDWTSRNVFEPVGNAFESVKTEAIKKWDNAVSKFSAMFEGMGRKWDELIAGGKALLDRFLVNPVKAAKKHVTENHAGAVAWTTDKMEKVSNAAGDFKDKSVGLYESGKNAIKKLLNTHGTTRVFETENGIETRKGGSVSWRNNNPGNLKFEYAGSADKKVKSKRTKSQALASAQKSYDGVIDLDQWGNAIFSSEEVGRAAQAKLLKNKHGNKTIEEMLPHYAKDDYSGKANTQSYANGIYKLAQSRGLNLSGKKISELNQDEFNALLDGMKKVEHFKTGEVTVSGGAVQKSAMPTGLRIKSKESTAGGQALQGTMDFAKALQDKYGDDLKYFSAFNDAYHQKNSPNSGHTKGLKFDAVLNNPKKAEEMKANIEAMAAQAGVKVKVLNEYAKLSKKGTGGHLDVGFANANEANKFAQFYATQKMATVKPAQTVIPAMPTMPSVLPKTTAIAEAPALTMPIASDARKAEKTLVIAPEIGQDLPDPFLAHIVAPYMRNAKV